MNKICYSNRQVCALTQKIIRDITNDQWRPDYIVGLTRGGLTPAVMISHYLNIPMYTLDVSLRDNHTDPESNLWMSEDAWGYGGTFDGNPVYDEYKQKNILIVDDINDTGATLDWIIQDWQTSCLPDSTRWNNVWSNNVRFAVLTDNASSKFSRKVDYCGTEINKAEDDAWIVFPWENWWEQ